MISKLGRNSLDEAAVLAAQLWKNETINEIISELSRLFDNDKEELFLYYEQDKAIGFAQCALRADYVEGTNSSPVGYLEGIYVLPAYRRRSTAIRLLKSCENWAREQGCIEFASDCTLTNYVSEAFHSKAGFEEVERIIHFKKSLL